MSSKLSRAEYDFCMNQKDLSGSFMKSLFTTIFSADTQNLFKLSQGYPDLIEVVLRYRNESGYWGDLKKRWNEEYPHSEFQ